MSEVSSSWDSSWCSASESLERTEEDVEKKCGARWDWSHGWTCRRGGSIRKAPHMAELEGEEWTEVRSTRNWVVRIIAWSMAWQEEE